MNRKFQRFGRASIHNVLPKRVLHDAMVWEEMDGKTRDNTNGCTLHDTTGKADRLRWNILMEITCHKWPVIDYCVSKWVTSKFNVAKCIVHVNTKLHSTMIILFYRMLLNSSRRSGNHNGVLYSWKSCSIGCPRCWT